MDEDDELNKYERYLHALRVVAGSSTVLFGILTSGRRRSVFLNAVINQDTSVINSFAFGYRTNESHLQHLADMVRAKVVELRLDEV